MWSDVDTKLYKVANFPNSDGEPFGLTIKGKGKHVDSHSKVMETLNRLQKDKPTTFGENKITITDKVKTSTILNAKVTLTTKDNEEGQVELKIHKPSDRRHKATIEIRRLSGHDFETVEKVKDIVTNMLDEFTSGESVSRIMLKAKGKAKPYTLMVKQPSLSIKLLSCNECNFKIKIMVALNNHINSNHRSKKSKCDVCGFESKEEDVKDHMSEFHIVHQNIKAQNKRKKATFDCDECGVTVDAKHKLKNHKESQHLVSSETLSSSEPSPPRKKPLKHVEDNNDNNSEVEMMDIKEVEQVENKEGNKDESMEHKEKIHTDELLKKDENIKSQAKMIEEQANKIKKIDDNVELLELMKSSKVTGPWVRPANQQKPILNHLTPVQDRHLKDLMGIRMKCNGNPGGDCLSSCTTLHISNTNDSSERRRVNRKINNHIADNYDTFYVNKIALPYSETIGVGSQARWVTCNNREELLNFLRAEDSLCAFSNSQELLTICNMLNTKIHIFTYGIGGDETKWGWNTICPDPDMARFSDFPPGTVPDMLLYNSENCHYDLLVEDHSKLAVMGLISLGEEKKFEELKGNNPVDKLENYKVKENEELWNTVKSSKKAFKTPEADEQKTAVPDSELIVLQKNKQKGHKRDGPQSTPVKQTENDITVTLEAHMETLKVTEINCDKCQEDFQTRVEFESHIKNIHSKQWNCDKCDFQGSTRVILMNHCKKTPGHTPSKQQRQGQTGVLECYTCRSEFRSYHNLMTHRKEVHPSHKKCRYFLKGECKFTGDECWYLHEDKVETDNGSPSEVCYECKSNFETNFDFMEHKKNKHQKLRPCKKFERGICDRTADDCWNKHYSKPTKTNSTGQKSSARAQPLQGVQQEDFHQQRPATPPDQTTLMEALNMSNMKMDTINTMAQRLQALEKKIFPQLT